MYIKRYTIASLIFIVLVGWYVYAFVTQESLGIDFFGIPLPSLSIALLVIIPLGILYFTSVLHMSFYSFMGNMRLKKQDKDYEKLIDSIVEAYLGKSNREHTYKTQRYELLGTLLDNSSIFPTDVLDANTSNEKINNVLEIINKIKNGEVVEMKKLRLLPTNPLVIQNEKNRYAKGEVSAEDILNHSNKYDENFCKEIYKEFAKTAPFYAIESYKSFLTKESLLIVLARINADENTLEASSEALIALIQLLDLSSQDYILCSSTVSLSMIPEQRIKLFEMLSEISENSMEAYLYTLYDLEMVSTANELLDVSQANEYPKFKAYRALKECNKQFNIDLFI